MWTYNNPEAMQHHGVIGMRWGVRKGVKKEGKNSNNKKNVQKKVEDPKEAANTKQKQIQKMSSSRSAMNAAREITNQGRTINKEVAKTKARQKASEDIKNMSDSELQAIVNRKALEQRYIDVVSPEMVSKGHVDVDRVLNVVGGTLAIGTSATALALSIRQLKG